MNRLLDTNKQAFSVLRTLFANVAHGHPKIGEGQLSPGDFHFDRSFLKVAFTSFSVANFPSSASLTPAWMWAICHEFFGLIQAAPSRDIEPVRAAVENLWPMERLKNHLSFGWNSSVPG